MILGSKHVGAILNVLI